MRREENRYLQNLGRRVYSKDEIRNIVKEEPVYTEEEKKQVRQMYDQTKDPRHKRALKTIMEDGSLEEKKTTVDQEAMKKAERKMERRIQEDIRRGRIQPAEEDAFTKKVRRYGSTNT